MDSNPKLKRAIDEILTLEWPVVTHTQTPQSKLGDGTLWIPAVEFFEYLSARTLQNFRDEDEAKREQLFEGDLTQASMAEKKAAVTKGQQITQATRDKRAEWAAPIIQAVEDINQKNKKKGLPTFSWCPTPKFLGGCEGSSASRSQVDSLLNDKRIQKALP